MGGNYFVEHLTRGTKGWIVWDKGQHGLTMSDCELAYTSFDVPTRIVVMNRAELLKDGTFHPTQKPVKLYEWVISRYAKEGDKIIDTHAGSGACLVAAHRTRHEFLGFEIDAEYFRKASERIKAEQAIVEKCETMLVGRRFGISEGMAGEIGRAKEKGICIQYHD